MGTGINEKLSILKQQLQEVESSSGNNIDEKISKKVKGIVNNLWKKGVFHDDKPRDYKLSDCPFSVRYRRLRDGSKLYRYVANKDDRRRKLNVENLKIVHNLLSGIPFFDRYHDQGWILELVTHKSYEKDDVIWKYDDPSDKVMMLFDGEA